MRRTILTLRACFRTLAILVALTPVAAVASDTHLPLAKSLMMLKVAVDSKDLDGALTALYESAVRCDDYYSGKIGISGAVTEVGDAIDFLGKGHAFLDKIGELAKADAVALRRRELNLNITSDSPLALVRDADLKSGDPEVRLAALIKVHAGIVDERNQFEKLIDDVELERRGAETIWRSAEQAAVTAMDASDIFAKIEDAPKGVFERLPSQSFLAMQVELAMSIQPALNGREGEAKALLQRYKEILVELNKRLDRFTQMEAQVRYDIYSERERRSDSNYKKAAELAEEIRKFGKIQSQPPSDHTLKIARMIRKTIDESQVTLEIAKQMVRQADRLDAEANAQQRYQSMLGLASSLIGLAGSAKGGGASSQNTPRSIQFTQFESTWRDGQYWQKATSIKVNGGDVPVPRKH